ncbi:Sulfite reductase [Sphaceloma murrayae]|uniref:Sulfite reductase n=1 Tax=Sphaceloma murrayae TaxID=2082308 RepID=A0A2K1QVQ9_9PEZI|nr:Sulfite reductase [Sphaceloma murrayae]
MLSSFPRFNELPYELRARIWYFSVEPRFVEVMVVRDPRFHRELGDSAQLPCTNDYKSWRLVSRTPVPAILHTCQEARGQGLYQRTFANLQRDAAKRYVWVCFDTDTIDISSCYNVSYEEVAPLVKRLKLEAEYGEFFYDSEQQKLRAFSYCRDFSVICTDGILSLRGTSPGFYWPSGVEDLYYADPFGDEEVMRATEVDKALANHIRVDGYRYPELP